MHMVNYSLRHGSCIAAAMTFMGIVNNVYFGTTQNLYDLGKVGEIPCWLVFGYIPINPDKNLWAWIFTYLCQSDS